MERGSGEGPVSDLLNVDSTADATTMVLKQQEYIALLLSTYLLDGVPLSISKLRSPASETLLKLVESALMITYEQKSMHSSSRLTSRSSELYSTAQHTPHLMSLTRSEYYVVP
eukprot:674215-Pleurochrysis_carterae.AAC.2